MSRVFGAALEFLQSRFKGELIPDELEFVVGAAAVQVAGGDAERVSLTMVNLGATNIFLSPSLVVSAIHGLRLAANGGTVSMNVNDDSLLPALDWWAIGDAGGGALFVLTVRRNRIVRDDEAG